MRPEVPLPWERLLWSGRSRWPFAGNAFTVQRWLLTDFRLVTIAGERCDEIALDDIREVTRLESRIGRPFGISTLVVHSKRRGAPALTLAGVRRGAQIAAVLELLASEPRAAGDPESIRAALRWEPRLPVAFREATGAFAAVLVAIGAVAFGLHGSSIAVTYAPDDAIAPNGMKRSRAEIVQFMERDVMPWARGAIGRLKGGPEKVSCETCHGVHAERRDWLMPSVAALPEPEVKDRGWERYSTRMDAQMRNAIYGYQAESEKSAKAAYMREVVVPGMAALLHREPYDFTKTYEFNRARNALGCYHCHRVN